jgi:hypothetical protein
MIDSEKKYLLNKMNAVAAKVGLGDLVDSTLAVAKATFDVASLGGAVGDISLGVTVPSGALVKKVYVVIKTPFVSAGGAGTLALKAQSAGDLLAAVDADTLSGVVDGIPAGAAANMIVLTADRVLTATVAVEALTAGKADVFVEYVL